MAFQTNSYNTMPEIVIGHDPRQPSSATSPLRRRWWSQPIATYPSKHDREPSCTESMAYITPYYGAAFTIIVILVVFILYFVDHAHFNAKFSIQSISVSPSSATWHVDFLVKNPSSWYSIYYGGDETEVRVGPLNTAVLNTSHKPISRSHTAFSVNFVVEDNPNDVILGQLDIKLRAKHKVLVEDVDVAGHINIRCRNLTRSHENVEKIRCHSSFTGFKPFTRKGFN